MINVGILGYGFAGRGFHAYLLTHEPRLNLAAVATRDPGRRQRAEADYGVRTFETLDAMLADGGVDLVIIATPHDVHAAEAVAVMDAGKHCVCDKVMCLTGEEAGAMLAARDRNGVLFSVFHNRRWDGDYLTVRQALEADLLGAPRFYEIGIWRYGAPRNWRSRKEAVGTIMHDWGAHFVDQMFQLVPGRAVSVTARAQYGWPDLDIESYLGCDITFENGVFYRIELSNRARLGKPHWYIVGDRGSFLKEGVDPQEAAMLRGDIQAAQEDPATYARVATEVAGTTAEMRLQTVRGDWTAYYRNVADALLEGAELAVKPEEARRGVLLLETVQESVRTGRTVTFEGGL
ncbi:MAG TPA: Gfo/Idh/MocA family oxidoreductase [Armatimonadota bacterium]|nr:Gfo/Idh/MocA family oxidoreductase [Armatimonadota bacterium]